MVEANNNKSVISKNAESPPTIAMSNEHFGYPSTTRPLSGAEGQGKRSVQAINNEQLRKRARKMPMHALYKGDAADATPLYKHVACNDTLGAKRYSPFLSLSFHLGHLVILEPLCTRP